MLSPLKNYDITCFTYAKSYVNGSRIFLGTHPELLEEYLSQKYYMKGNAESMPNNYSQQAVLWSTLPNQSCYQMARKFDIDHGIYLIYPNKDGCEFFTFASSTRFPQVINFYLNNFNILESFVFNFRERARKLIQQAESQKIVLPFSQQKIHSYKMNGLKKMQNAMLCDKAYLLKSEKLTIKEYNCLKLILSGLTTKEIAKELILSPRTIEDYINSLKLKFNARNKVDLITKVFQKLQ